MNRRTASSILLQDLAFTQVVANCSKQCYEIRPKLHVYGHIHGASGIFRTDQTAFVKVAALGSDCDLEMSPLVLLMPHH